VAGGGTSKGNKGKRRAGAGAGRSGPAPAPALKPAPSERSGGGSGGGGGKKGKAKVRNVDKIHLDIVKSFLELVALFQKASEDKDFDELDTQLGAACTLWGKKRGALISSSMVDEAAEVQEMIATAQHLRAVLVAFNRWLETRSVQAANTLIGACGKEGVLDIIQEEKGPSRITSELCFAQAQLSLSGGNIGTALKAISIKTLIPLLGEVSAVAQQASVFKREFTMMMRSADERKLNLETIVDLMLGFVVDVIGAAGKDIEKSILKDFKQLQIVLVPEQASGENVTKAIEQVRASEMLKGFRVFDCGNSILVAASTAIGKLEACRSDVQAYTSWLAKESGFTMRVVQCCTSTAFEKIIVELKANCELVAATVKTAEGNTIFAKCILAENNHSFNEMCHRRSSSVCCVVLLLRRLASSL
jgi:hypothetical protein